MRIFGIDPGSERTGYGCVETDGRRHRLVACGAITASRGDTFPQSPRAHPRRALVAAGRRCQPDCVAIENLFHATNVRSALKLGHARGVAMLAAVEAGCEVVEYTPAEIKRAVVGYGRAEKHQVGQMVKLLLGLAAAPSPHDAADALAVAICHSIRWHRPGFGIRDRDPDRRIPDPDPEPRSRIPAKQLAPVPSSRPRMIAFLRGRVLDKHPNRIVLDVNGVGYEVLRAALHLLRHRRRRHRGVAARAHARARGCAAALWISHAARAAALRAPDRDQRHRAEAGHRGPLRHREPRARRRRAARRHRASDSDSRCRQEDRRAHRARAEGSTEDVAPATRAPTTGGRIGDRLRDDLVSALENLGYHRPLAEQGGGCRARAIEPGATFEDALKSALRELMR